VAVSTARNATPANMTLLAGAIWCLTAFELRPVAVM
jgi:hypothetical protein